MKIINWLVTFISNTFGTWHFPWVEKKFNMSDYFELEKRLREMEVPFVIGLVKTNGFGSNVLITIAQCLIGKTDYPSCNITHALAHIGLHDGFKHRVVESIGDGVREVSLLKAIGQRDVVIIRIPNPKKLNSQVCKYAIEFLKDLADRDRKQAIKYDLQHDYDNADTLDCSETIYLALEYGFKKADQESSIKMINRAGKKSWAPADIRFSDLFIDFYVTGKGFTNGNL